MNMEIEMPEINAAAVVSVFIGIVLGLPVPKTPFGLNR